MHNLSRFGDQVHGEAGRIAIAWRERLNPPPPELILGFRDAERLGKLWC